MHRRLPPTLLALLLLTAAAPACTGEPLPADKAEYAGHWRGPGIDLVIREDGTVAYEKREGAGHVRINGPIKGFDGDDFVVGVMVVKTKFDVSVPPHQQDGQWTMTVDDVVLVRSSP